MSQLISSKKKILITGINGFIGSYLATYLINHGYKIRGTIRNRSLLEDAVDLQYITTPSIEQVNNWKPYLQDVDAVIHLAGVSSFTRNADEESINRLYAVNVQATIKLAEAVATKGDCRFIFISSIKVNGESNIGLKITSVDQPKPETPYAQSKYCAEKKLRKLEIATGMELVIIRPAKVYGPTARGNLSSHMKAKRKKIPRKQDNKGFIRLNRIDY